MQVTPRNTTVQRITQTIHPVGRGKKKALLAHIIQQHNWSQVLVFTRTKFGANNVAEFLTKNGIHAMALHGNKSQAARTQALAGFKSGDIRALVATDIAARGIDIDDLPHVVNFDIPNVSEDYVHRIGRTGRAGADGAAVSLVCLDEEGFMQDIERYTKQNIEVQLVEGFEAEPDERAEPIAMGRQTIWGGAGKPPSRDVMMAAGRAARTEMLERVRDNRGNNSGGGGRGAGAAGGSRAGGAARSSGRGGSQGGRGAQGGGNFAPGNSSQGGRNGQGRDGVQPRNAGPAQPDPMRGGGNVAPRTTAPREPDPMRTSVDMMAERSGARRGGGGYGGYGGGNRSGGGSYGGGGGRSGGGTGGFGGGGNGSRGPGGSRGSFNR